MSLLKLSVLSVSGLTLWLAPPFIFSRKIPLHNFMQGIALVSGFACCFEARRDALKLAKAEEFEALKEAAINADVADELATEIYVSEQQRRQEAEQILASSKEDVEEARKALEAIYSGNFPEQTEVTNLNTVSEPTPLDKSLYAEICKSREAGKSQTWIIENILKMKGRKFGEGKLKFQSLLDQFEGGDN